MGVVSLLIINKKPSLVVTHCKNKDGRSLLRIELLVFVELKNSSGKWTFFFIEIRIRLLWSFA